MMGTLGHTTCLTPPMFIEVHVARQESDRSCMCVLLTSIVPLSMMYLLELGTVPKVFYFFLHYVAEFSISTLLIVVNKILLISK